MYDGEAGRVDGGSAGVGRPRRDFEDGRWRTVLVVAGVTLAAAAPMWPSPHVTEPTRLASPTADAAAPGLTVTDLVHEGRRATRDGRHEAAVDLALLTLAADPMDLEAWALLADACRAAGDPACAERAVRLGSSAAERSAR